MLDLSCPVAQWVFEESSPNAIPPMRGIEDWMVSKPASMDSSFVTFLQM
jgi:hypothetical protein